MCATELLSRLLEIERAIGVEEPIRIREMLMEAQECVLELQKNAIYNLREQNVEPAASTLIARSHSRLLRKLGKMRPNLHRPDHLTTEAGHYA